MIKHFIHQLLHFFYPFFRNWMPYQVFAYLSVGAANTLFNIALFIIGYQILDKVTILSIHLFALELATIISFAITVCSGFWLSKNFAFTDASAENMEKMKQFGKYGLVSLQGQLSDYLITKGLVIFLLVHPSVAYIISTIIMLSINYFLQKYFTFRATKIVLDRD